MHRHRAGWLQNLVRRSGGMTQRCGYRAVALQTPRNARSRRDIGERIANSVKFAITAEAYPEIRPTNAFLS